MADSDVIVVGAGLAGLVATAELADAGRRVLLLDQEPAPGIAYPLVTRSPRRAAIAVDSSLLNGASSCSDVPRSLTSTPFTASASKKISDSDRPASCGSWVSRRPVTVRKASGYASRVTRVTSTSVRSMFQRTRR